MAASKWRFIGILAITLCLLISVSLMGIFAQEKPMGEEALEAVVLFYHYDKSVPLDGRVISEGQWEPVFEEDHPCKIREKVVFTGGRGDRVPGYLGIPKAGTPPYPCVLQIHGGSNRKLCWWEDESFSYGGLLTKELLSAGFAVLALDAQYHGERIKNNDYELWDALRKRGEHNKVNAMWIESTVDYCRAIDYLETRSEIDTERIGVIGYSMGAMLTFTLKVVEPRIKAAIACSSIAFKSPPWPALYAVWAPYHFATGIGDGEPILMINGRSDEYCPAEDAQGLFESIKSPTKELFFYESGHKLPPEYVKKAAEWFKDYL